MGISPTIIVMTEIMIITNFLFSMINRDEYDVSTNRFDKLQGSIRIPIETETEFQRAFNASFDRLAFEMAY